MLKIGLTGGIGSGKSVVAKIFRVLGIPVYDADARAKVLMNHDPGLKNDITGLLGDQAYRGGSLDSPWVAGKVFGDPELLTRLNAIVHPAVHRDFQQFLSEHSRYPYVIEEAAILFESGQADVFDFIVVVDAPAQTRKARVMKRDGVSQEDVQARMDRQMPAEEKKKWADFVIINDGRKLLIPQIMKLHNKFVSLGAKK